MSQLSYVKTISKNLWVYEIRCRRRNHHEPMNADLEYFLKNTESPKLTHCIDCNFPLELRIDEEDTETYWVSEI